MKVRLLSEVLREFPDFANKIGWKGAGALDDFVLWNNNLGEVLHVVICKDDGTPMWDQFLHNELIGAVTLPVNKAGQIGLITIERPIFKGEPEFPLRDFSRLGDISIECPRGFPFKGESSQETAAREAGEELGSPILSSRLVGYVRPNSSFHPHKIPIFLVEVDEEFEGTIPSDVNEKILKVEWFSVNRVEDLIKKGEITCGFTQAALCQYFVRV